MHHSNPPPTKDTKHLNPQFEIISYEYFIVHTPWNDHLKLHRKTTTKIPILCTPCQNATLLFDGSRFTLDLKY